MAMAAAVVVMTAVIRTFLALCNGKCLIEFSDNAAMFRSRMERVMLEFMQDLLNLTVVLRGHLFRGETEGERNARK
jgi:hypothetical protein